MENTSHAEVYGQEELIKVKTIICIGAIDSAIQLGLKHHGFEVVNIGHDFSSLNFHSGALGSELPYAVICDYEIPNSNAFLLYENLKTNHVFKTVPFIVVSRNFIGAEKQIALKTGIDDFYTSDVSAEDLIERISHIIDYKKRRDNLIVQKNAVYQNNRIVVEKRIFDILISAFLIALFSPLMLLIALIIKLESRGPIFYISKRVGTGYRIFNFIKFRSMKVGADEELTKLLHLNQYNSEGSASFIKISNDPRITRFGKFIRKTSLDELPQLFNVLRGDMSLVGNRPLPLYEAEKLTTDMWAKRFLAPAGITGLWQVTKRGKKEMSERERILLDVNYADKTSFWFDVNILFRTIPALLQKEAV